MAEQANRGETYKAQRVTEELAHGQTQDLYRDAGNESFVTPEECRERTGVAGATVTNIIRAGGRTFYVAELGAGASFTHAGGREAVEPGLFVLGADGLNERHNSALHRIRQGESVSLNSHAAPSFDSFFGSPEGRPDVNIEFHLGDEGLTLTNHAEDSVVIESRPHEEAEAAVEIDAPEEAEEVLGSAAVALVVNEPSSAAVVADASHGPDERRPAITAEVKAAEKLRPKLAEMFKDAASIRETLASDNVDDEVKGELARVLGEWDSLCQAREINEVWDSIVAPHLAELDAALPEAERGVAEAIAEVTKVHAALVAYADNPTILELKKLTLTANFYGQIDGVAAEGINTIGAAAIVEGKRVQASLQSGVYLNGFTEASDKIVRATSQHEDEVQRALHGHGDASRYDDRQLESLCREAERSSELSELLNKVRGMKAAQPGLEAVPARRQALETLRTLIARTDGENTMQAVAANFGTTLDVVGGLITSGSLLRGNPNNYKQKTETFAAAVTAVGQFRETGDLGNLQQMLRTLRSETEAARRAG